MSDSDLENAVRAKFEDDPQLKAAKLDVDADADKNEITIAGQCRPRKCGPKPSKWPERTIGNYHQR